MSKTFIGARGPVSRLLDNVSFGWPRESSSVSVGPSGCGKSTLLNIIAGLEKTDSGIVLASGKPIHDPGRDRMVMFQEHALFPWLDVMGNVLFGLKLKPGLSDAERLEVAKYYLDLAGLS